MMTPNARLRCNPHGCARATVAALLFGWLLAGCATPEARIKRHPDLFAGFPPDVQQKVRSGIVETGFTRDMVYIALGRPDRTYSRQSEEGESVLWVYTRTEWSTETIPMYGGSHYRDRHGNVRRRYDWSYVEIEERTEYDSVRVEFEGDRVTAIVRLTN